MMKNTPLKEGHIPFFYGEVIKAIVRNFLLLISVVALIIIAVAGYGQSGGNDRNGTDCLPESYYAKAGIIPLNPYTGNIHLEIKDIEAWGSVGDIPLVWMRYGNSRSGNYDDVYGNAFHWNGSFMYSMMDSGVDNHNRKRVLIHYPEGGQNVFTQDSVDLTLWSPLPGVDKRLFQNGNTFTLQTANGSRYQFEKIANTNYQLQFIFDAHQNKYTLQYNNGLLVKVTEPAGRFLKIDYTTVGSLAVIQKVSTSDGRSVTYNYALNNNWVQLVAVNYGDNTQAFYEYSQSSPAARPLLAHAVDPRSNYNAVKMRFDYNTNSDGFILHESNDSGAVMCTLTINGDDKTICYPYGRTQVYNMPLPQSGLAVTYTDGLGRQTNYKYDNINKGFLKNRTDALGRTTQTQRTLYGNVLKAIYPDNTKEQWTRDDLERILTYTDELGRVTSYTRDANHNITRVDYPDATFETFIYNNFSQVLDHQRKNGGVEHYVYDDRGLMTSFTDALGNVTHYSYDGADRLASKTDARNNTTAYEYNERGLLIKTINPDLSFRVYGYDDFGNLSLKVDELNDSTSLTYDDFRRLLNQTAPLGHGTDYSYAIGNKSGNLHDMNMPTRKTTATGKVTAKDYDVEWELSSTTEAAGTDDAAVTNYEYDMAGNLITTTDANGNDWTNQYDVRDRKIASSDPLGNTTTWLYNQVGDITQAVRPDGGTTFNKYDAMDRLTSTTDPKNQTTKFKYDAEGNTIALTDPKGAKYSFEYDLLDRKTKMIYPGNSFEAYTYDAVGNLQTYTNRNGDIRTYTYDNRNRDTHSQWSDNTSAIDKTYDVAGRLKSIANNASTITYNYNKANELMGEKQKIKGSSGKTINYRTNGDGMRDSLTYPDGTVLTYNYTQRNQLASIAENGEPPVVRYQYDSNSNRIAKTLENNTKTNYKYDAANRLLVVDNRSQGNTFARFDYGYDNLDRRTFVQRNKAKGDVYSYDVIDQVTGVQYDVTNPDSNATNPARTVNYNYDATGNRITLTDNNTISNYTTNLLNQYTKIDTSTLNYDNNGNLKKYNGWTYKYDAQNRMINAGNGTTTITFKYDALNRCVSRTTNGSAMLFYYDDWNLIEERDGNDVQLARYINGANIDEILKREATNTNTYSYHDALGNVVSLADNTGALKESYTYDVYGAPTIKDPNGNVIGSSAFGNRFMFTGREYVTESMFYYFRYRMYMGILGKFLRIDPLRFESDDYNLYRYVWNSSTNAIDPFGLDSYNQKNGEYYQKANQKANEAEKAAKQQEEANKNAENGPNQNDIDSLADKCAKAKKARARADYFKKAAGLD